MFKPAHIQYSYLIGFYTDNKLIMQLWYNGCTDSVEAEQNARKNCNDQYYVKTIDRDPK